MNIPAFHGMKYLNRILINDVVVNLKRFRVAVKTDKQPFVFGIIAFQFAVILNSINSPPNIGLAYTMLESRLAKLDLNIHVSSIFYFPFKGNPGGNTAFFKVR
jgi:hypothetical protein